LIERHEQQVNELAAKAMEGYYLLNSFLNSDHGRKASAADLAESLRQFPTYRYQNLVHRQICRIYMTFRSQLADLNREFVFCKQRLDELMSRFRQMPVEEANEPEMTLFPSGCGSIDQAVQILREGIRPDELRALDRAMQKSIEGAYQALFSVCMSSINMLGNLHGIVEEQSRAFLASRIGDSNVGEMFFAKFDGAEARIRALKQIHELAAPPFKTSRPVTQEICVLAVPEGDHNAAFLQIGRQAIPGKALDFVPSSDEILVYREWPRFPLVALPQLSPSAEDAYNYMKNVGFNPHSRTDVGQWSTVD
jgi:hypothetical protein